MRVSPFARTNVGSCHRVQFPPHICGRQGIILDKGVLPQIFFIVFLPFQNQSSPKTVCMGLCIGSLIILLSGKVSSILEGQPKLLPDTHPSSVGNITGYKNRQIFRTVALEVLWGKTMSLRQNGGPTRAHVSVKNQYLVIKKKKSHNKRRTYPL